MPLCFRINWSDWRDDMTDFLDDRIEVDAFEPIAPEPPKIPGASSFAQPLGAAAQVRRGTFVMGASGRSVRVPILGDPQQTEFMRRIESNTRRSVVARAG